MEKKIAEKNVKDPRNFECRVKIVARCFEASGQYTKKEAIELARKVTQK